MKSVKSSLRKMGVFMFPIHFTHCKITKRIKQFANGTHKIYKIVSGISYG